MFVLSLGVTLTVLGIVQVLQGAVALGAAILVAACFLGPGGYTLFTGNRLGARRTEPRGVQQAVRQLP